MVALAGGTAVHRLGGKALENFRLQPKEKNLNPPGISVHLGSEPVATVKQMLRIYNDPKRFSRIHALAERVASSTVDQVRAVGFDVIPDPSTNFPNHGRLVHPRGIAGFDDVSLQQLASAFVEEYI